MDAVTISDIQAAIFGISEQLQPEIIGRLGRETDELVDASTETLENCTIFVRIDGQADTAVAYYDPMVINLNSLGYDAPVRMKRVKGRLSLLGTSAASISSYYSTGVPSNFFFVRANGGTQGQLSIGSTLDFNDGDGIDLTLTGTALTIAIDSSVVTLSGIQTLTNKTLTSPTITTPTIAATGWTNANHAHTAANSGGTLSAAAIASGTLVHERGGLEADISAYDGFIRIAAGATSNLKSTFNSVAAPTTGDDSGDGFTIGSRWLDTTNDKEYVCLDATLTAAVWVETTGGGAGMTSFTLAGTSGTPETITDGNTVTIAAGTGITTTAGATDTVTVAIDSSVVTLNDIQTLTNKTLTTPVISGGTIDNAAIGGTTPAAGAFTTLTTTSTAIFSGDTTAPAVNITGAAATQRRLRYQTAGSNRWILFTNNTAESGANAGSNFVVRGIDDAGTGTTFDAISISRATGDVTFSSDISAVNIAGTSATLTQSNGVGSTVLTALTLNRNSSAGAGLNGIGVSIALNAESSTTENRQAGLIEATLQTVTDASRASRMRFATYYTTTEREVIRIEANSTEGLLGFFGVTAAVRSTTTTDIKDALTAYGLLQGTSATPLNLDGGALTTGAASVTTLSAILSDAVTNAVSDVATIGHNTSGTAAAAFGTGLIFNAESSTTADQTQARIRSAWVTATHASRAAFLSLNAYYLTTEREGVRIAATSTDVQLGFYGATPVSRPTYGTPTGTLSRATYATTTVTTEQLAQRVYGIISDLEALGLFA